MSGHRAMIRIDNQWQTEHPDNLSRWMRTNDGAEAVVVCDKSKTYYCGRPEIMEQYREAWAKERKVGDKRQAAMFWDLDKLLFIEECKNAGQI